MLRSAFLEFREEPLDTPQTGPADVSGHLRGGLCILNVVRSLATSVGCDRHCVVGQESATPVAPRSNDDLLRAPESSVNMRASGRDQGISVVERRREWPGLKR